MTKSATRIQDKDTQKRASVVQSTEDPTKYGVVLLNPDGSRIRGPKGEKGDKGDKGDTGEISVGETITGQPGTSASVENKGTSTDAILEFTIPRGDKGEKGDKGDKGDAAIISVGTTTTLSPGSNATVNNSGTSSNAVFNFGIPRGDKGNTGDTGNGIINTTKDKVGKVTTVTFTYANGNTFDFSVSDGEDGEGAGDVLGPSSSVDGNIVVFDGITGKLIKDSGKTISALETAIGNNTTAISTINGKIPNEATANNQLADKDFVNSSINSVTAFYITRDAQGDQFTTKAQLDATTTFYSGGVVRVPTRNDYCIVVADETHDNATTRYIYQNQWEFQYVVNETALTAQQLAALNSGITSSKVSQYDGYATNKQNTLVSGDNIKTINGTSILGSGNIETPNTTYNNATQSVAGLMSANDKVKLDGIEAQAQKNTVTGVKGNAESTYRIGQVNITPANLGLENKAAASGGTDVSLVTTGDKYNWNNIVIKSASAPSSPTAGTVWYDTTNNVLKVYNGSVWKAMQELLVSGTNIKTINNTSVLGTGNIAVQATLVSGTNIKTVNSTSLLGSGNIAVQPTLVSGTNIKTINGNSILGSGNITVSSSTTTTCTLTSAGWSSKSQTVSVSGVTASNTVIVSPAPSDIADYADCGVYCSAQGSGTLTFGCDTAPSGDIVVNVLIMS